MGRDGERVLVETALAEFRGFTSAVPWGGECPDLEAVPAVEPFSEENGGIAEGDFLDVGLHRGVGADLDGEGALGPIVEEAGGAKAIGLGDLAKSEEVREATEVAGDVVHEATFHHVIAVAVLGEEAFRLLDVSVNHGGNFQ